MIRGGIENRRLSNPLMEETNPKGINSRAYLCTGSEQIYEPRKSSDRTTNCSLKMSWDSREEEDGPGSAKEEWYFLC